jgi:hypothetical protein
MPIFNNQIKLLEITRNILPIRLEFGNSLACFAQDSDDLDLDRLPRPDLHEPSLEDPDMECFAPSGGHYDLSEPLQHNEPIDELSLEHPVFECFA